MSEEARFVVRKKAGRGGWKSQDYEYLLNGQYISRGLLRVLVDFLPANAPLVTLKINPKLIDVDASFMLNIINAQEQNK